MAESDGHRVEPLTDAQLPSCRPALVGLLRDVVDCGASVGFLPPLAETEACAYWDSVAGALRGGGRRLWIARGAGGDIIGTVQLNLAGQVNGRHRAEVIRLMVHRGARQQGVGRALMEAAETEARRLGRTTLVLDTRQGEPSERLYRKMGWQLGGTSRATLAAPTAHSTRPPSPTSFSKRSPARAPGSHMLPDPAHLGNEFLECLRRSLGGAPSPERSEIHAVPNRDPGRNRHALPIPPVIEGSETVPARVRRREHPNPAVERGPHHRTNAILPSDGKRSPREFDVEASARVNISVLSSAEADRLHRDVHLCPRRRTNHDEIQVFRMIGALRVESSACAPRQDSRNASTAKGARSRGGDGTEA